MNTVFIGIVGPSGSGKTTLCKKLKLLKKFERLLRARSVIKIVTGVASENVIHTAYRANLLQMLELPGRF